MPEGNSGRDRKHKANDRDLIWLQTEADAKTYNPECGERPEPFCHQIGHALVGAGKQFSLKRLTIIGSDG